jgi:hypothetical protein
MNLTDTSTTGERVSSDVRGGDERATKFMGPT